MVGQMNDTNRDQMKPLWVSSGQTELSLLNVTSSSAAAAMVRGSAAALSVLLAVLAGG